MTSSQSFKLFEVFSERWRSYMEEQDWDRAHRLARVSVDAGRRALEDDEAFAPFLVEAWRELALTELARGEVDSAASAYRHALGLAGTHAAVPSRQRALLAGGLAGVLELQGRIEEAIDRYLEGIAALEELEAHEAAAGFHNNAALLYKETGRLACAETHYLSALETLENLRGRDSLDVASLYNNIGGLYQASGLLDRALDMHLCALEIREAVAGEDSAEAGQSLSNIAAAYHVLGKTGEAARYYERACEVLSAHEAADPETLRIARENRDLLLRQEQAPDGLDADGGPLRELVPPTPRPLEPVPSR